MESNAAVQAWVEITQQKKGDSLTEGYISELWDFTHISVTQNNLQEIKEIWDQWDDKFQIDKAYSRAVTVPTFLKKLMNIKGMNEQWVPPESSKKVTPVPAILAETFRSLNACRRTGEDYSPLKELASTPRRDDIIEGK
ncbi:hypothetical protein CXB51_016097 [Gossypium anomalum]|uniref:Uncharacterized protein n=1 Tax=Gossypium anomalum TaxID=47600 RepID=A0A8J6CZJ0_9ROSI|nr:hypothetical protein CXB51_016097 [Gossypium anomalum]